MKIKTGFVFFMAAVLPCLVMASACAVIDDIGNTTHENNASATVLDVPIEKVASAIPDALQKVGYTVKKTSVASAVDGEYQADGLDITYRKLDSHRTKLFVRVGAIGKRDKEALIIDEIKKGTESFALSE